METVEVEIASQHGERERCKIEFEQGPSVTIKVHSDRFGALSFNDKNLFSALSAFRRVLERQDYLVLCSGARRDAYPSRMALQMGGGRKVYLLKTGKPASREDLVDIWDSATIDQVCGIAEQKAAYDAWLVSLE